MLAEGREIDVHLVASLTDMVLKSGAEVHERQIMALVNRPNATTYLHAIDCPTLLITGNQDRWSPVAQHQEILKLMPRACLKLVNNAGHFMPIEQPEETSQIIKQWLEMDRLKH